MNLKELSEKRLSGTLPMLHQDILENKVYYYSNQGREELNQEHKKHIQRLEDKGENVIAVIGHPSLDWNSYVLAPINASEEEAQYFAEDCEDYIALYAFVTGWYDESGYIGVEQTDKTILRTQ
jgi:hypothetical protein